MCPCASLATLTSLVDKSLVTADTGHAEARYHMLEPVRQLAAERCSALGLQEDLEARHLGYFVHRLHAWAPRLKGSGRPAALDALRQDHANLALACETALGRRDERKAAELAERLAWYWYFSGRFEEGRRWGTLAQHVFDPPPARVDALAGTLAWIQGDCEAAGQSLQRAAEQAERNGDHALLGEALRELGGTRYSTADLVGAIEALEGAADALASCDAQWDLALCKVLTGDVLESAGRPSDARMVRSEAGEMFEALGDPWGRALALFGLAHGAARAAQWPSARDQLRAALDLQRAGGDRWNIAQCLLLAADVELADDQAERAAEPLREALVEVRVIGDRASAVYALRLSAMLQRARGQPESAARLLGAASGRWAAADVYYPFALLDEDALAALDRDVRGVLGDAGFAAAYARGAEMSMDQALAFAADPASGQGTKGGGSAGPELRIVALGAPEVHAGTRRVEGSDWGYALPRELLFFLLAQGPASKDDIGLSLWPDASPQQLRGRFRTTLYQLRKALGRGEWVRYADGRYGLEQQGLAYDVKAFESNAAHGLADAARDSESREVALEQALALYRGEYLESEPFGDWVEIHRERLRSVAQSVALELGRLRLAAGALPEAVTALRRALDLDDLDERSARALAEALARDGQRSEALAELDRLIERLHVELDAEPGPETAALRQQIASGNLP